MWSSPQARPTPLPAQRSAIVARGRRLGNSTQAERGLCRKALWPRVLAVRLVCARSRSRWTVLPVARSPISAGNPAELPRLSNQPPVPRLKSTSPEADNAPKIGTPRLLVSYRTERPFDSRICSKRHQKPGFTARNRILSLMLASIRLSEHRRIRQSDLNPLAVERMDGHVLLAEPDGRLRHGIVSLPFPCTYDCLDPPSLNARVTQGDAIRARRRRTPRKAWSRMGMTLREEIANAFRLHRAGELILAARLYQTILSRDPEQVDALYLLGVLRQQQGQFAETVELYGKAVALRPGEASFHSNLSEAYRALGQFEQAVGCCRAALTLRRDYPEAHNNLGLALHALGQFAEAAEHFQTALALRPNYAQAHANLGITLRSLGEVEPAIEHLRKALELNPKLTSSPVQPRPVSARSRPG